MLSGLESASARTVHTVSQPSRWWRLAREFPLACHRNITRYRSRTHARALITQLRSLGASAQLLLFLFAQTRHFVLLLYVLCWAVLCFSCATPQSLGGVHHATNVAFFRCSCCDITHVGPNAGAMRRLKGCLSHLSPPIVGTLLCMSIGLTATMLYGIQWAIESIDLQGAVARDSCGASQLADGSLHSADEVAAPCHVGSLDIVSSVCYVTRCSRAGTSGARVCATLPRSCFKARFQVSLTTLNGLAVLSHVTKGGSWGTVEQAKRANEPLVGTTTTCFYTPGDGATSFSPASRTSSWIPIAVFGVAYAMCSVCACICAWQNERALPNLSADEDEAVRELAVMLADTRRHVNVRAFNNVV